MNHWAGKENGIEPDGVPTNAADRVMHLGDLAPSLCPRCAEPMELAQADDQLVIGCRACHGLLVQSEVLGQLISRRRQKYTGPDDTPVPMDRRELDQRIQCPGCSQLMDVHPYHGPGNAVIDSCWRCKLTFLDRGELARIERAPGQR